MKALFISMLVVFMLNLSNGSAQTHRVKFATSKGDFIVLLYDKTPAHRDLFLKLVAAGDYKQQLFNRVVKQFVNQGGILDETTLALEAAGKQPVVRLPAEIVPEYFHKKGALGAGRDDNPQKASYVKQPYFVIGKVYTDAELDSLEIKKGIRYSAVQRAAYKSIGGAARLDGDYTIYGEVVEGLDVVEKINNVSTDKNDVPIEPIVFSVTLL